MKVSLAIVAALAALAAADPKGVEIGEPVPKFTATDDQGNEWKSADHVGEKILVVYFYPADMTGGCTAQACSFRDDMGELKELGVEVVGVSGDSAENHRLFKKAHNLNFTLLADEKGEVAKLFGVPTKPGGTFNTEVDGKKVALTTGVRAARWTFVIGPDGKVVYKNTKVKPAEDSKAVREVVRKLTASSGAKTDS
ncbi:MAG: peroxiredoxin [Planctomycetaceae bacterium]